jgi:hypothetical protein
MKFAVTSKSLSPHFFVLLSAMTPRDIAHHRLDNQQIVLAADRHPGELVARLGSLQAQDYLGALWAIGLRLPVATEADIEKAIADRKIVRTWPMRGTLHFVAAADVRWMLELLTPRIVAGAARRRQQLELDDTVFARCEKLFIKALQGGRPLMRDEMYEVLSRAGIAMNGQRGYHILWRLAQEGLICFGPRAGKQPTFVLLDEWVSVAKNLPRDRALAELARRYFTSHGPATIQDFVWWSGLTAADAKAGLELASPHLAHETIDGKVYWMAKARPASRQAEASVHLLPGFDQYLLGYRDRGAVLDAQHALKIVPGSNGMFMPTIVSEGRVVGIWKRTLKKNRVVITGSPFTKLSKAEALGFATAAERYGRFLGLPVEPSLEKPA